MGALGKGRLPSWPGSPGDQGAQVNGDLITGPQQAGIPADAGGAGDDEGVKKIALEKP